MNYYLLEATLNGFISEFFLNFFYLTINLLSLRLTGVETLKSFWQNFKRRFHFLFLVSVAVDKLTVR